MAETRKLAAILAADVVGFSRLTGADEDRKLARLRALPGFLRFSKIESSSRARFSAENQKRRKYNGCNNRGVLLVFGSLASFDRWRGRSTAGPSH